jgi:hypothetical protein
MAALEAQKKSLANDLARADAAYRASKSSKDYQKIKDLEDNLNAIDDQLDAASKSSAAPPPSAAAPQAMDRKTFESKLRALEDERDILVKRPDITSNGAVQERLSNINREMSSLTKQFKSGSPMPTLTPDAPKKTVAEIYGNTPLTNTLASSGSQAPAGYKLQNTLSQSDRLKALETRRDILTRDLNATTNVAMKNQYLAEINTLNKQITLFMNQGKSAAPTDPYADTGPSSVANFGFNNTSKGAIEPRVGDNSFGTDLQALESEIDTLQGLAKQYKGTPAEAG